MNRTCLTIKWMLVWLLIFSTAGFAADETLPVIDGKSAVASVNGEPISLEELNRALAASHAARSGEMKAGRIDFSVIMERLINTRLILLEAGNMGLDDLPEIKASVEAYSKRTMRELLLKQELNGITADEAEVARLYKESVKEWRIKEATFKKEADARKAAAEIKAGNSFDGVVSKAVAQGIAEGGQAAYLKDKDLKPQIAALVSKMEVGATSSIIPAGKRGFIIFKLEGVRYPEQKDPEAMAKARRVVLIQNRAQAARAYYEDLKKRYANINKQLIETLDYESKTPGFASLLEDKRVVAEIKGEDPITVGDLSAALKEKFYHGVESAIEEKKLNKRKGLVLEGLLEKRILLKEAFIQGIDRTEAYKERVKEYKNSLLFGTFINKVIAPDIRLSQEELKAYYHANRQTFTSPEMLRLKSLVFAKRSDAVEALEKLKKGTDFTWMSAHAQGQLDKNTPGLLNFDGSIVMTDSLPEGVQKAVYQVHPGDFRLYAGPEGHFYVLYVYHVVAPELRPFDQVKQKIAKEVYNQKLTRAIGAWAAKLKAYYPVKIFKTNLEH